MSTNYGMVGKFVTDPDDRDALLDILAKGVESIRALDGCHLYVVSKDADKDDTIWVMELWETKAAHDHSLTLPALRDLINQAMPLLKSSPEGSTLIPVSGKGLLS